MALEYEKRNTFWHKLDARTKVFWFIVMAVQIAFWDHPIWQIGILITLLIIGTTARVPWKKVWGYLKYLLIFIFITALIAMFAYSPEFFVRPESKRIIFELGRFKATLGGLLWGIGFSFKLINAIILIGILTFTTPFTDILYVMQKYGFSYKLTLVIANAWRMAPMFSSLYREIVAAQRSRGWESEKGNIFERAKKSLPALAPLFSYAIGLVERMALAMESRAFGAKRPTLLKEFKFKARDYAMLTVLAVVLALSIYVITKGWVRI